MNAPAKDSGGQQSCERARQGAIAPSDDAADAYKESLPLLVKTDDSTATGSSSGSGRNSDGRSSQSRGSRSHGRSRSSTGSVDDVISSLFMLTNFQMQCSQRDGAAADDDDKESLPPLVKRDAGSSSGRGRSSNSRSSNSRSSNSRSSNSRSSNSRKAAAARATAGAAVAQVTAVAPAAAEGAAAESSGGAQEPQ